MKISEILHKAADEHLAHDRCSWAFYDKSKFSCFAVERTLEDIDNSRSTRRRIAKGLENMGCPVDSSYAPSLWGMDPYEVTKQTQGARYMWLKFAALMAEEQGV